MELISNGKYFRPLTHTNFFFFFENYYTLVAQMIESACKVGDLGSVLGLERPPWKREWQPTPVYMPGEVQGQKSLVSYNPWGCKESDVTELL